MDKRKNRPFLVKQPAVGILTPTEIFTSYKPDGSFSTGAKDIGIPGVCGTAHADEHIYRMAMNDVYESRPLQTGATYTWTSKSGVGASVTAHEDVLQVTSSGGEYGLYLCPIIRYSGSIVRWLEQLVKLLDLNVSPRGPLVGTGFDGVKPLPTAQAISDAAAASDDWAQTAYGGKLIALFDSVYRVQPPEAQPLRSDVLSADTPLPPNVPLLTMHPSAEDEQELVPSLAGHLVIGDLVDGGSALATGVLVNGAASTAADATVELSNVSACVTVKVDPEDAAVHGPVHQGRVPSYPRALAVQPVLEAIGSLQAPRRRAREQPDAPQAEPPRSSRPRREAPPTATFCHGQRVSCVFEHNGAPTAFHGAVMRVHDEFRSCDVDFDDGRSHRVAMARLTCL